MVAEQGAKWFLLVCRTCTPPVPMPFVSGADRGRWAAAHTAGTGHAHWAVYEEERPIVHDYADEARADSTATPTPAYVAQLKAEAVARAMVQQETLIARSERLAASYAELAVHAQMLGLDEEADRLMSQAERERADAERIRQW